MKTQIEHESKKNTYVDIGDFDRLPTPIYDAKGNEVKKYLALGGAKYIAELGEALRQDWAKDVSMDYWKRHESNPARLRMRRKLIEDWSDTWSEEFIIANLAEFLIYPAMAQASRKEDRVAVARINMEKARQAKAEKYRQKIEKQSKALTKIVTQSPEPPKPPEEEVITAGWSTGPSKYQKLGGQTKSPLTKMGDIRDACRELWTALTEKDFMPGLSEDVTVEYIKPTREYRKFVYELDEHEQTGLYNWLVIAQTAITDMLDILDKAKK